MNQLFMILGFEDWFERDESVDQCKKEVRELVDFGQKELREK